jgi:hypothetical protein
MLKTNVYSHEQDHIYYDLSLINNSEDHIRAEFVDTRPQPILSNSDHYNVAVARIGIPTDNIQDFFLTTRRVSETTPGAQLEYEDQYTTLTFGGVNYSSLVVPTVNTNTASGDHYIYFVKQYLTALNTSFLAAYTIFNAANPAVCPSAPMFIYNPTTRIITLICDDTYRTAPVEIWVNWNIYKKIPGIYSFFNGYYQAANANFPAGITLTQCYKDYKFNIADFGNNINTYQYPAGGALWDEFPQEIESLGNMMDLQTIVLTSNLPTIPQWTAVSTDAGKASSLPILTDFEPIVGSGLETTNQAIRLQYQPSLYRLIPMIKEAPIKTVQVNLFWQDKEGRLNPILIAPGESVNIKILFIKKGLSS